MVPVCVPLSPVLSSPSLPALQPRPTAASEAPPFAGAQTNRERSDVWQVLSVSTRLLPNPLLT